MFYTIYTTKAQAISSLTFHQQMYSYTTSSVLKYLQYAIYKIIDKLCQLEYIFQLCVSYPKVASLFCFLRDELSTRITLPGKGFECIIRMI